MRVDGAFRTLIVVAAATAGAAACRSKATSNPPDGGMAGSGTTAGTGGSAGTGGRGGGGASGTGGGAGTGVNPGDSVLMHHKNLNRDGVYAQPTLTRAAAAGLKLDTTFNATFTGSVYAQPLYVDNRGGTDLVIVATEADTVLAFDASSGRQVWMAALGTPAPLSSFSCGNIDPLGITGTPVIDLASRTLFVTAMTTPDGGGTKQYKIFGLSIDDGAIRPGWPIDVGATVKSSSTTFMPGFQSQRAALALVNGILYVPFGGLAGDCGDYRGWVVAVPIADPTQVQSWATAGKGGGIWSPSGVSSDGSNVYVTTGNTLDAGTWAGGEAIFRFPAAMPLAAAPAYWAPTEWKLMDDHDLDLSGEGPIVFDLPGATPSHLVLALGKSGTGYLNDAGNLAGIADPLVSVKAGATIVTNAMALYRNATATLFVFRSFGEYCTNTTTQTDLATLKIVPGSPPTFAGSWCVTATGNGAPMVTTTDGTAETIVWVVGAEGNNLLQGFNGDTGEKIFAGGAAGLAGSRRFNTPIAAKGRIFYAADRAVVAFTP